MFQKAKVFILYAFRILLWTLRSTWRRYPKPKRSYPPYSRSYMRKAWKPRLQSLDQQFNRTRDPFLLYDRHIAVAKRRQFQFE